MELIHQERLTAIGQLSSQITHELRNPLSSIGLNSELLMEDLESIQAPQDALDLLTSIINEVIRGLQFDFYLTDDLY